MFYLSPPNEYWVDIFLLCRTLHCLFKVESVHQIVDLCSVYVASGFEILGLELYQQFSTENIHVV